jgi:hypothetical protein
MQRYVVIYKDGAPPCTTQWYDYQNNWDSSIHRMIIDLAKCEYTENGTEWHELEEDHL